MDPATIAELTGAFNVAQILDTFMLFAPYIVGVIGVIVGISLVRWGFRKVRSLLSRGV